MTLLLKVQFLTTLEHHYSIFTMSYRSKSTDSFITRKRLFIFYCVINNIKDFSDQDFLDFKITDELIQAFTAEFYQFLPNDVLFSIDCKLKISDIYTAMTSFEKNNMVKWKNLEDLYFKQIFPKQFPKPDFDALSSIKECAYCGITMEDISELAEAGNLHKKNERGWCFEIDRKKPNYEYTTENCVAACYWCNNAKTDEFDDEEFRPIGRLIGETLRNRLKK